MYANALCQHIFPTTVVDRPGLEKRACKCYVVVKKEFDRLLPDLTAK